MRNHASVVSYGVVLSVLCIGSSVADAKNEFKIFNPPPNFIDQGRCHMGECSVAKWLNVSTISSQAGSHQLQITLHGGSFPENPSVKQATWNEQPHFVQVQCSRAAPKVGEDLLELNPEVIFPGVMENAENIYWRACHSYAGPDAAKKLGYSVRISDSADTENSSSGKASDIQSIWSEPGLASMEGWWGMSPEGCYDIEDNQYRIAVGRFDIQRNDLGPVEVIFGKGEAGIGMYGDGCTLGELISEKDMKYTFAAICESEGEKTRGNVTISKTSKFTLNIKLPGEENEQGNVDLVACPK